jgi:O-antigen ligase
MTPFFVAYLLIPKENLQENLEFFLKILLIVVFIAFIYGIGEHYLHFPVIITQNNESSKGVALFWTPGSNTNSTFAGQYDLAAFMVMTLPIFLSILFVIKDKIVRLITLVVSGTGLWLLINSFSRISQVSYVLAVSVPLLILKKFKGLAVVLIISLFFMVRSSGLDMRFASAVHVIYEHITATKTVSYIEGRFIASAQGITPSLTPVPVSTPIPVLSDVSIAIRLNVEWPRAFRAIITNPLLGTGYSSIGLATDNDYLRMLGETGLLGLLAFALIFFRIGKIFVKAFPLREKLTGLELSFIAGMVGAVIGTFVIATFIDLFEASKFATIFWLLLGFSVNLIKSKEYAK